MRTAFVRQVSGDHMHADTMMRWMIPVLGALALGWAQAARAQDGPPQEPPTTHQHEHSQAVQPPQPETPSDEHAAHAEHTGHAGHDMSLFDGRDTAGTGWAPVATPMLATHVRIGAWTAMVMGNAFFGYLQEFAPDERGGHQVNSTNWLMGMARRRAGAGVVGARLMLSAEPLTVPGCGYPDLLATGEQCDGDSIHDRQHPHDLLMELAAEYSRPLVRGLRWHLYGGPAGEPALGPVAFPHRASAMANPIAPISHHWLDATHLTYGIVTSGVSGARWRAEASIFNGREPDERRTNVDFAPPAGLASLVTAVLFLLSIFLASIAGIVPQQATAPVLMLVGWFMFKPILDLNKIGDVDFATGFAVLLTVFVMPLTYSITNGIGAGFVAYVLLKTASGKMSEVSRPMLIAAIAFAVYFADPWIRQFVK